MKTKPTIQRLKRTAVLALVFGTLVYAGLFMTGCKEDVCDKECKFINSFGFWLTMGPGLDDFVPCRYDYEISPGDSVVIDIPDLPYFSYGKFVGCSPAPWTLTATPAAGITAKILRGESRNNCVGLLLEESQNPGDAVSISGPAGCMSTGTAVIEVRGSGAAGTITVEYN